MYCTTGWFIIPQIIIYCRHNKYTSIFLLLTFDIGSWHQGAFKWQERIVDGILPHSEIIIGRIQYTYSTIFTSLGGRVSKKIIYKKSDNTYKKFADVRLGQNTIR